MILNCIQCVTKIFLYIYATIYKSEKNVKLNVPTKVTDDFSLDIFYEQPFWLPVSMLPVKKTS